MERAWYEMAKSVLSTGDAAFIGIMDKGKFYWKVFSYLKGDVLYPHYDRITGSLMSLRVSTRTTTTTVTQENTLMYGMTSTTIAS